MKEYIIELSDNENALSILVKAYNLHELVRCKDCKHWYFADNRIPSEQGDVCGLYGIAVTQDWYCADGMKKE